MIDTIIFDIGRVLVKFDWQEYIASFHFPKETADILGRAVFLISAWPEYDRSALPDEEILTRLCLAAPGYEKEIRLVFDNFPSSLSLLPHAIPWITSLKKRGFHIYYLSNYAETTRRKNPDALAFIPLCDGGLMSCDIKHIKPEPEIYQALLTRFQINPENAVFIDDSMPNLEAAKEFCLHTILFENYPSASAQLERLLAPPDAC